MAKGVFTSKVITSYDDLPEEKYHFPKTYLNQVKETVGDWILYYEPRRIGGGLSETGGRQSYFATALVSKIEEDKELKDHYYAYVTDYLEFDTPVPFKVENNYFEQKLVKDDGSTNKGAFGRSVRILPNIEYDQILNMGFGKYLDFNKSSDLEVHEETQEYERRIVETLVKRPLRDRVFASNIKNAYSNSCAMTGIKLVNINSHYEVEAAHIRPVGKNGPDSIRNGLALSRTFHWMFDNGLITISDEYCIITDKKLIPDQYLNLINKSGELLLPNESKLLPHQSFLKYHRDHIFRG
ncbi:MAG: restriction endonuclease [Deltaproteobacteria bacterium]|nr:restriction endonuclease [Deltaproteobacteria bacterium]